MMLLLASFVDDLQYALEKVHSWVWSDWDEDQHLGIRSYGSLPENGGLLALRKRESKYLGVLLTGSRKMEQVVCGISGNAGAALDHCSKAAEIWFL